MDFSKLFPGAADWVASLPKTWPFSMWQDVYAPFGAIHLVGLALLGGCVILLNLRLMGAGLTEEQPSTLERNLRPWLITGFVLVFGRFIAYDWYRCEKVPEGSFVYVVAECKQALSYLEGEEGEGVEEESTTEEAPAEDAAPAEESATDPAAPEGEAPAEPAPAQPVPGQGG